MAIDRRVARSSEKKFSMKTLCVALMWDCARFVI